MKPLSIFAAMSALAVSAGLAGCNSPSTNAGAGPVLTGAAAYTGCQQTQGRTDGDNGCGPVQPEPVVVVEDDTAQ
ncbi:MAG: hypothetical protein JWM36_3263 [Hyphomicrobiales bacterium]|nr:hypothetical protein [Hyphomicrobiales bacterium]